MKAILARNNQEIIDMVSLLIRLRWPNSAISIKSGDDIPALVEREAPDIVLLEASRYLGIIQQIRQFSDVALLVITEKSMTMEGIRAVELGADDFITQPIDSVYFLSKIGALLRRINGNWVQDDMPFSSGNLVIDFLSHEVFVSGEAVKLTPTEYNMLSLFVRNERKVLPYHTLFEKVWGLDYFGDPSLIKKCVLNLRRKLDDDRENPKIIVSVRGVGYRFAKPVPVSA